MLLKTQGFEFDDFLLDEREKVLTRAGQTVPITPKAFELLVTLVENHGHLLSKDDLLQTVWANSFVEEGNLTFTIRLLRKALGDSAQQPRFIETVTKRGYRFIAEVRRIESESTHVGAAAEPLPERPLANENGFAARRSAAGSPMPEPLPDAQLILPSMRSLFGREREIAAVEALLGRDEVKLITLTGAGGSGKTSLARFIAANRSDDFPDGVFFVELAPVFDPELVIASIAQTLEVKESGENSLLKNLQSFLRDRCVLLVLDNFEQILAAAPTLEELLLPTQRLKILVTSRVALRLNIENELLVPPLALPPKGLSASEIINRENYPSIQMFVERARSVKPFFTLNEENASDVAKICTRLDGLPLAIELAAARTKLLTPSAILKRLEIRLQILSSRVSNLPARQQTMRTAIAWSFDLLGENEKQLFRKLAVFAGGFTIESAEKVCSSDQTKGAEILDGLESLVANNLLQQSDENGESHLLILETIREYAAELLAENAENENEMRRRHAEYFLDYARRMERGIMGADQVKVLNRMEAERYNFRAAMDFWRNTSSANELKLTAALTPLWTFRGYLGEGIERLSGALEKNPGNETAVRAKALASLGQLIWVRGDYVQAIEICERSLALARQINYPMMCALSLFFLGMSHWYRHDDEEKSISYLTESLELYRELEFDSGVVFTTVVLAAICQTKDDLAQAARFLDESMAAAARSGNNLARSIALVNYGRLKFAEGDHGRAKVLCQESLRLREELSDLWGIVQCLEPLTAIAVIEGAPFRAARLLGAIDRLLESLGAQPPLIFRADHEPSARAVRAALDEKTFARLFDEGRRMPIADAVALALEDGTDAGDVDGADPDLSAATAGNPAPAVPLAVSVEQFRSFAADSVSGERTKKGNSYRLAAAAAILTAATLTLFFWYMLKGRSKPVFPVLSDAFSSEKLSTNGKVFYSVVSPDGKNVYYVNDSGGRKGIWLRQLDSGSNIEIIPSSDEVYAGLEISPQGDFLYFVRRPRNFTGQADIYRVSSVGGVPQKIVSQTQGWMSISPDGARISFVRCYYLKEENCSLWIADAATGANEKKLASRPRPLRIADNEISPDGRTIAFAAGHSRNAANDFTLNEIDLASGAEREISAQKFFNINGISWLPDKSGLLITALKTPNKHFRIWQIEAASGAASPLTNDSETYSNLSLDKNAAVLIATSVKADFHLKLIDTKKPDGGRILANASQADFAPDGKIVFASLMSGNSEIWIIEPDGFRQKQLTNDPSSDAKPVAAPDGKQIYFSSNRTGEAHVWRMNADGSDQTQLTKTNGGLPFFASPDGKWVYYYHGLDRTLWRVSPESGEEQMVYDQPKTSFAVSNDGSKLAFAETTNGKKHISIVSAAGGAVIETFEFPISKMNVSGILWMPDGKNLAYILTDVEADNSALWLQALDRSPPRKLVDLGQGNLADTPAFAVSPDERYVIVAQGGWLHDAVLFKGLR